MAKKELSQTQRNQALSDLRNIAGKKRGELNSIEDDMPNAYDFVLNYTTPKMTLRSVLDRVILKIETSGYRTEAVSLPIDLFEYFPNAKSDWIALKKKKRAVREAKSAKFERIVEEQEMKIKYGDNVDDIMSAFKAIENVKL